MELKYEGYEVYEAVEGRIAVQMALQNNYDLILLDLMLPEINRLEVCRRIRKEKDTLIIMLTNRDSVMDKVTVLQIGADDYLAKPFAIEELLARMEVLFRRMKSNIKEEIRFKDIILDIQGRIVKRNNENAELTNTEFQLLFTLMKNKNKVMTRDILLDNVWAI